MQEGIDEGTGHKMCPSAVLEVYYFKELIICIGADTRGHQAFGKAFQHLLWPWLQVDSSGMHST
jgi:hypothetical protein